MSGLNGLLAAGGLFAGLLLLVFLLAKFSSKKSRQLGKAEGVTETASKYNDAMNVENEKIAEANRQIVEEVEETHETHDRLERDPTYRKRVRDRFTRD